MSSSNKQTANRTMLTTKNCQTFYWTDNGWWEMRNWNKTQPSGKIREGRNREIGWCSSRLRYTEISKGKKQWCPTRWHGLGFEGAGFLVFLTLLWFVFRLAVLEDKSTIIPEIQLECFAAMIVCVIVLILSKVFLLKWIGFCAYIYEGTCNDVIIYVKSL